MTFIDEAFIIFLGFLVFMGLCWYYLAKPTARLLDGWVRSVREELAETRKDCHQAHLSYQEVKNRSQKVSDEIRALHEKAAADIQKLQQQAEIDLRHILATKDKTYEVRVAALYHTKLKILESQVMIKTFEVFQERLRSRPSAEKLAFLDALWPQLIALK